MLGAARVSSGLVARRWRAGERVVAVWQALRPYIATVAALACFTIAAFMWHLLVGIVVLGLSFLVVDWYADVVRRQRR